MNLTDKLMRMVELCTKARSMSNRQIGSELLNAFYGPLKVGSEKETILSEAIERLDNEDDQMKLEIRRGIL